jgi:two-component system, NarL family, sensor histidine kinase UhpB
MSLRVRVVVAIALVLLLGSVAGVGMAGWQARQALHEELTAALTGGRQTVASAFEDLPRSGHPARDLRQLVATFDGNRHVAAALIDSAGRVLLISRATPATPAPAWFNDLLRTPARAAHIAVPVAGYGSVALTPVFANDVGALWTEFIGLTMVLAASLLIGSAVVWLTVGRALRPLADFSSAFVRIGSGDYAAKVREQGPEELTRLGRGVNDMARRLGAMQTRNRALEEQLRTLQDEERADLARDLHDEIGPHLFAANVDAAMARRLIGEGKTGEALVQLTAIQAAVGHMQGLVRDILGRLRPTELIELGLTAAIGELVDFWRARHPTIRFEIRTPPDEDDVGEFLRETVYRVIQESLNNAVRHGRPGLIDIEVTTLPGGDLIVRVTDDGAPSRRPTGMGFGLIGMRERVAAAHGELTIAQGDAGGWSVIARLPAGGGAGDVEEASAA